MEALQIALANGELAQTESLRSYFARIFEADGSGTEFPVNLEHVWRVGYSRKDAAVRALQSKFVEGVDYQSFHRIVERENGASMEEVFELTVSCLEYFAVRANRAVFEVYRACRMAVRRLVMPNYPEALRMLAEKVENEQLLLRQVAELQPAAETMQALTDSGECVTMSELAKTLAIPTLGLINLYRFLRKEKVIQALPSTEPYQRHVSEGHFKRVQTPYMRNGEQRLGGSTVITPHGVTYIMNLLRRRGLLPTKGDEKNLPIAA
jgi:phage antirepressor YoqD-like protein